LLILILASGEIVSPFLISDISPDIEPSILALSIKSLSLGAIKLNLVANIFISESLKLGSFTLSFALPFNCAVPDRSN